MANATMGGQSDFGIDGFQRSQRSGELFGHPKGLYVLFFTELWERFSFYGMKTLLVLYMINKFFWSQEDASRLLGADAFLAYGLPVVGGFVADRYLGAKRAVIYGAILLSAGHLCMAFEPKPFFYTALALIIAGVGLLKPNVSTQVGTLYKPDDPRRDGAFTIFYMGINLGALAGPLLCDWLRVHYGYHYGFAAAGVGMILGLIVYVIGQRRLVEFRQDVTEGETEQGDAKRIGATPEHPPHVVRDRILVLLVVFVFIILFWTAFEQSPNAMLVWADKHTNLQLLSSEPPPITLDEAVMDAADARGADKGWGAAVAEWLRNPRITSGQSQSFNPFFIITLAPVFAFFWLWLDRRKLQPSTPTKMVFGLVLVVAAFAVMWPAAHLENGATSATLATLPDGLSMDEEGFLYTLHEDDPESRVYYGAHRLRYDASDRGLHLTGVLTDLDRLRLLAETAPEDFKQEIEALAANTIEQDSAGSLGKGKTLDQVLDAAPADFRIAGKEAPKAVGLWNPETKTITVKGKIESRAKTELLAAAADAGFKEAVDRIYLDSSKFRVSVWWLIGFYLLLTMGELCISPVGLSLVTKLAPAKHVGFFMGGWFLATAVAEWLAQVFGAMWGKMPPEQYFMIFVVICGAGAFVMAIVVRPLKRLMHGVH
ncbi:MAG: peptide MFS transporter [Planctomycetes bacterium]|nr:peptide MFS transporter [Planctomycetota bacterium]